MNPDTFKTPLSKLRQPTRATATKRDSLAAELERDPQLSTAKRQQRAQVFNSTISHANLERQLLAAQTANSELETKLRERELAIERLERDRRWFADREQEEREEKERERVAYEEAKRKADNDTRTLRNTVAALREELADVNDAQSSLSRSTSQTIAAQKAQLTTLQHRAEMLQDELSQAQQIADERSRRLGSLQAQYDELSIQPSPPSEDMGVIRDELIRQADYLRTLEATNAKLVSELSYLRERNQSIEVLKEEKRGLEAKLVLLDGLREKVVRLEGEVDAARTEREAWAATKQQAAVTQTLSDLRLAHARLLEEHGATAAFLREREAELANIERQEEELRDALQSLEADLRSAKEDSRRKDSRVLLAEREVGYLQALLASYKAEEAYADHAPAVDAVKAEKLVELEALLQDYKLVNDQLANDYEEIQSRIAETSSHVPNEELQKVEQEKDALAKGKCCFGPSIIQSNPLPAVEEREAEITRQEEQIDSLEQELFELRGEIAGGRHVPPNTRVLCMSENPDQAWVDLRQATMDRIRGENEALIKRLRELEQSGATASSNANTEELVPRQSWEQVNRAKEELEEEVKQKEKRLLRLKQVFASKSAEFREAIASILGLKLAFYPNGQVRVTSTYDLNASFIFQPASKEQGARMQLVAQGEGGPQDLPSLMHYWIETEQCTAGFLASVTLECYENWKRNGGEEGAS